jgi:hypothetical protein
MRGLALRPPQADLSPKAGVQREFLATARPSATGVDLADADPIRLAGEDVDFDGAVLRGEGGPRERGEREQNRQARGVRVAFYE